MSGSRRSVPSAGVLALTVAVLALAACSSERNLTTGTVDPRANQLRDGLQVSGPLSAPASIAAIVTPGAQMVYLSMSPGTLPGADSVQFTPVRGAVNALTTSARMSDGGFDPVPVHASAGDSVPVIVFVGASRIGPVNVVVPLDRRPTVVRTTPPKGRTDVPLNQMIVIVFSQPLDSASVTLSSIQLLSGGGPAHATVEEVYGQPWVVHVIPSAPLDAVTRYQIVANATVRDVNGSTLAAPDSSFFTTGAAAAAVASVVVFSSYNNGSTFWSLAPAVAVPGGTIQFFAYPVSAIGDTLWNSAGTPFSWSSSDTAVATVDTLGLGRGITPGSAIISGCYGTICGQRSIEVRAPDAGVPAVRLGDLRGGTSYPASIKGGIVVGTSPFSGSQLQKRAFLWSAARGLEDLGVPAGDSNSYGFFVNAGGLVAGYSDAGFWIWSRSGGFMQVPDPNHEQSQWYPRALDASGEILFQTTVINGVTTITRWSARGGMRIDLPPVANGYPIDMNDVGEVLLGTLAAGTEVCGTVAYIWDSRSKSITRTIRGSDPTSGAPLQICANAINATGAVAGYVALPRSKAFRWTAAGGFEFVETGDTAIVTVAKAMNAAGDVVIDWYDTGRHVVRAAVWTAGGTVTMLGSLGGAATYGTAIEDSRLVVGYSESGSSGGPPEAVLWDLSAGASAARRRPAVAPPSAAVHHKQARAAGGVR